MGSLLTHCLSVMSSIGARVCVSSFWVPKILMEEIGCRTSRGMFDDYDLTRSFFLCVSIGEPLPRYVSWVFTGDRERRAVRSREFLEKEVLTGGLGPC